MVTRREGTRDIIIAKFGAQRTGYEEAEHAQKNPDRVCKMSQEPTFFTGGHTVYVPTEQHYYGGA